MVQVRKVKEVAEPLTPPLQDVEERDAEQVTWMRQVQVASFVISSTENLDQLTSIAISGSL